VIATTLAIGVHTRAHIYIYIDAKAYCSACTKMLSTLNEFQNWSSSLLSRSDETNSTSELTIRTVVWQN
jgi:hypothetical protein